MLQKMLSIFIAFSILFTGCSHKKIVHTKQDVQIRTFLTDKDENFYMFVGDKYSYIFEDKKTISELKELIELARSLGEWKLGNKPKIYLEKNLVAKINMTFLVKAQVNHIDKLKSMGFEVSTENPSFYFKDVKLLGKFGHTDKEIKEKFQENYLSHPMLFEQIKSSKVKDSDVPSALEVVGIIVMAPIAVAGTFIVVTLFMVSSIVGEIINLKGNK